MSGIGGGWGGWGFGGKVGTGGRGGNRGGGGNGGVRAEAATWVCNTASSCSSSAVEHSSLQPCISAVKPIPFRLASQAAHHQEGCTALPQLYNTASSCLAQALSSPSYPVRRPKQHIISTPAPLFLSCRAPPTPAWHKRCQARHIPSGVPSGTSSRVSLPHSQLLPAAPPFLRCRAPPAPAGCPLQL